MPIETICQNCARKLRVGDEHAGRKARCPHCKHVYTVPAAVPAKEQRPEDSAPGADQWRLRTEDGNVYGPVSKAEVDVWLTEGRVTAAAHLQRGDSLEWIPATRIYPALAKSATQASSGSANPFGASPNAANPFADGAPTSTNPYSAPTTPVPTIRPRFRQPHRGGTILAFGVVGIACCIIFAPIAWVMGQADLKQIRAGEMDPAGRGLTQAGMVLGIIGTVILAVQVIFGAIGIFAG